DLVRLWSRRPAQRRQHGHASPPADRERLVAADVEPLCGRRARPALAQTERRSTYRMVGIQEGFGRSLVNAQPPIPNFQPLPTPKTPFDSQFTTTTAAAAHLGCSWIWRRLIGTR